MSRRRMHEQPGRAEENLHEKPFSNDTLTTLIANRKRLEKKTHHILMN